MYEYIEHNKFKELYKNLYKKRVWISMIDEYGVVIGCDFYIQAFYIELEVDGEVIICDAMLFVENQYMEKIDTNLMIIQLKKLIDLSLDRNDKESFLELCVKLNEAKSGLKGGEL